LVDAAGAAGAGPREQAWSVAYVDTLRGGARASSRLRLSAGRAPSPEVRGRRPLSVS